MGVYQYSEHAKERDRKRAREIVSSKAADTGKFRVCNVDYLNAVPFKELSKLEFVDYQECEPTECARRLHEGEADLACIPIAEYALSGCYEAFPFGIVADDKVESVYLFSDCPIEDLETVYLDVASQTSVVLLRLLLSEILGDKANNISFSRMASSESFQRVEGGAGALVIGNDAWFKREEFSFSLDLSEEWTKRTGLPFVFAVWAFRPGTISSEQQEEIEEAFEKGIKSRAIYAREWADNNGTDREDAEQYVSERISHVLSGRAITGAGEFFEKAQEAGIFPPSELVIIPVAGESRKPKRSVPLDTVLLRASEGKRISIEDGLRLAREASIADLSLASDVRKESLHKDAGVSYIVDRNINYTNICNVYCRFCAFYRAPGKEGGYLLSKEEIGQKIQETVDAGGIQILLQGGLHPELGIEYYEDLFSWIKSRYPINLHALSSDEIWHIGRVSNLSNEEVLKRLIAAGLGSLPGGGGEILIDSVRRRIARLKTTAEEWLDVHKVAHRLGITSTCTMMFGVHESWEDRIIHMHKLRQIQDETGGFTAFITWPYQEDDTGLTKLKSSDTSSTEYLRVQAVSRLFLDNISNIQSSWVTQGPSIGQVALYFGANDFGSVMFEENVVSSAGTTFSMNSDFIERHISDAGFEPWRRDVHYGRV